MGGFLTIGYCSRTTGYCFPCCFLEIFVGRQGLDGGRQCHDRGIPTVPQLGKPCWMDAKQQKHVSLRCHDKFHDHLTWPFATSTE